MTNGEKYKTAKERDEAFDKELCNSSDCLTCKLGSSKIDCHFAWLDLEAEDVQLSQMRLTVSTI